MHQPFGVRRPGPLRRGRFDQLAALLERPVFPCCGSPQPDSAGTRRACGAELTDDQLRALVDCTHPIMADVSAGERWPCPDCGLVWCQALAAINVQHYELPDGRTSASLADSDVEPCERRAIGARRDGRTFCTAHQAGGDVLIVTPAEGGSRDDRTRTASPDREAAPSGGWPPGC